MRFSAALLSLPFLACISGTPTNVGGEPSSADLISERQISNWAWSDIVQQRSPSDPENLRKRIVYNPRITYPTSETVWTAGSMAKVTWDASDLPKELSNSKGQLKLGYTPANGDGGENLSEGYLAKDFPLSDGKVSFTVPGNTKTRNDYIVVLFGDSGNASPKFTIQEEESATPIKTTEKLVEDKVAKDFFKEGLYGRDVAAASQ
ncbi:hypothetical protein IE53DRAFT_366701 [Violaceomyces palustris]|uniref:Uncharacterized protein n=1 Tax=Violaceomyces palustris TaxID=1673888 RepID=A0ACD0P4M3_9BASI|nr:hypothetical protein IE53DRAFT_366701 [Violaceomyces palustris]